MMTAKNAERTYVDPSALRSSYVHDDRSARFCAWRTRLGGPLPITRFGRAELINSFALAVHRGVITAEVAIAATAELDDDVRSGRLTMMDAMWRRTLDLAAELSAGHSARIGTRTLDVLHVATAKTLGMTHFVSNDARQTDLAKVAGLRIVHPQLKAR